MVAAENRQLWNRLSKLTKTNKSLGSQLTKISDTLKQHSPVQASDIVSYNFRDNFQDIFSSTKEDNNQQLVTNNGLLINIYLNFKFQLNYIIKLYNVLYFNTGEKEQSLEEISLRLINSIMLEKSDLEQQYAEVIVKNKIN